jgi:hypothetical protein
LEQLPALVDFTVHHAAVVFSPSGTLYFTTHAVPLRLHN